MESVITQLNALADPEYRKFQSRIVSTPREIIGVRMPYLRALARKIPYGNLPPLSGKSTYEEVMLHGLVIAFNSKKTSIKETLQKLDSLIPQFDNWAHVDTIISALKIFNADDEILAHFLPLKTDKGEFTKRTFVVLLMDFFLDSLHINTTLKHLSEVPQGQYYVDMAIAWAISVALVKHYDLTIKYLETPIFTPFTHNKAIQKARESFRISLEKKEYLGSLKI